MVDVRSRDNQNFSDVQIIKFSYPWCSAARVRAPLKPTVLISKCDLH